jgi:hypothetical protein
MFVNRLVLSPQKHARTHARTNRRARAHTHADDKHGEIKSDLRTTVELQRLLWALCVSVTHKGFGQTK